MLVTVFKRNNRYTGEWQRGDWSKHSEFNSDIHEVMTLALFNEKVKQQNASAGVITLDEIAQASGYRNAKEMLDIGELTGGSCPY